MWDGLIPIAIVFFIFVGAPLAFGWARRAKGLSAVDRQSIESLQASAARLEQRVVMLERAVLEAERGHPSQRMEV